MGLQKDILTRLLRLRVHIYKLAVGMVQSDQFASYFPEKAVPMRWAGVEDANACSGHFSTWNITNNS